MLIDGVMTYDREEWRPALHCESCKMFQDPEHDFVTQWEELTCRQDFREEIRVVLVSAKERYTYRLTN